MSEKKVLAWISSEGFQKFLATLLVIIVACLQLAPKVYQWLKIVSLLALIPSPFFVSSVTNKLFCRRQTDRKKLNAEEMYEFDNSIGNLEFDLEEIHKELKAKNKKLVYVIDELDKLENEQVKNVLKFFKNLFTLSDATFIFIGDDNIYNITNPDKNRPKEYTYFTSKYFISRPLWEDLSKYLDGIIENHNLNASNIEVFKRALCFDSKNDFFDLRTSVKDHVVSFDNENQPVIEFSESTNENIYKARLHKAVTVLFEQNYMSNRYSKWQENEELHKYLFDHAEKIFASKIGEMFPVPVDDVRKNDMFLKNDMIKDFYGFLHRHGLLKFHGEHQSIVKGQNVKVLHYASSGDAPEDFPDKLDALTAFEQRFIDNLELYCQYFIELSNAFNESIPNKLICLKDLLDSPSRFTTQLLGDGLNPSLLKKYHEDYCKLIKAKPPHPYLRETIEESTLDIINRINNFKINLPQLVSQKLLKHFIRFDLKQANLRNHNDFFRETSGQFRNSFTEFDPIVVYKPDLSRQVLLINNQRERIDGIKSVIKKYASKYHIVSFQEEDNDNNIHAKGLILVCTASPQNIKVSITKLLKKMNVFFTADNVEQENL